MPREFGYWFPAKRYGWGWGIPSRWQGWAVLIAHFALLALAARLFPPHREPLIFAVLVVAATLVLLAICWVTGESPRWRWGKK
ncbi:MAG: hypothetical protein JSS14_13725 [Proteobacteria bacterium]|nr:hypothetical protein [Pseudomonadota bacterium]